MNVRVAYILLTAAVLATGCSDDSDGAKPWDLRGDRSISVCVEMAEARCERLSQCDLLDQPSNTNSGRHYENEDTCLEREELGCRIYGEESGQAAISQCVTELGDRSCDQIAEDHLYFGTPRCVRQLRRPEGESCTRHTDCASNRCSDETCASATTALIGESCQEGRACKWWGKCVDGECQAGAFIDCARGDCELAPIEAAEGDRCGSAIDPEDARNSCLQGLECMSRNDMGAGQCTPYAADGEACGERYDPGARPCLWPAECQDGANDDSTCILPEQL